MASSTSLNRFLDQADYFDFWELEKFDKLKGKFNSRTSEQVRAVGEAFNALKNILEHDSSTVNILDSCGRSPFHRVVMKFGRSSSFIKLMLSHGANVNCGDTSGETLLTALSEEFDAPIIKMLLENGADVHAVSRQGQSALCHALGYMYSEDVVPLVLDAGCAVDSCRLHSGNVLRCATQNIKWESKEDVIRLILRKGVQLNRLDSEGRSPLCYVLGNGAELCVIKLLVAEGGLLNACKKHASPLLCATINVCAIKLKDDVVDYLLKVLKDHNPEQLYNPTPLQNALKYYYGEFEEKSIKLLFDGLQVAGNVEDEEGNTLLHLLMFRSLIDEPSMVKFLIKRGVKVNAVNKNGDTALHLAARHCSAPSIIEILLKEGCPADAENACEENPLQTAIRHMRMVRKEDAHILRMLFVAGSRIDYPSVKSAVERFNNQICFGDRFKDEFDYCKMLVKCYFLENSKFDLKGLIQGHRNYEALKALGEDCLDELQKMGSMMVDDGRTLRQFLFGHSSRQRAAKVCDINQLKIIEVDRFPVYFDIIAAKVGRSAMKEKLNEVKVSTQKSFTRQQRRVISANYDHLTDGDLLKFVLSIHKMDHCMFTTQASKENTFEGKRWVEQPVEST